MLLPVWLPTYQVTVILKNQRIRLILKKNVQNEYGKLLNKLIEGDADKIIKDAKKEGKEAGDKAKADILAALEKAFDKAAKEKSEKGKGPTYGELIKAGKLPVDVAKAQADYKAEQAKRKESEG